MTFSLAQRTGRAVFWKGLEIAGSRGLSFVRTLVLARLLAPEDFGLLAAGLVTIDVATQVTNFGMRDAVVRLPEPTRDHYDAAWTWELARTVLVAALLIVAAPLIAQGAFGEPRAAVVIRALALAPVVDRLGSIEAVTLVRQLRFRPVAALGLAASLVHAAVAIALARAIGVWALVVGHLAGVAAQTIASYIIAPHVPRLWFGREALRPLLEFGRGIFARQVVEVAGSAVLQVAIARTLGTAELGLYYVATRLAFLPREVARGVGSQVAFPVHAALQSAPDRAARAFRGHLLGIWAFLLPVYTAGIALAPGIVRHLVGAQWSDAAPALRVLAAGALLGLVFDATLPLLLGRGRSGMAAIISAARSTTMIVLGWWLAGTLGLLGACLAWATAETLAAAIAWRAVRGLLPRAFAGVPAPSLAILTAGALGLAVAAVVPRALPGAAGVLLGATLSLAASLATLWWLDRRLRLGLMAEIGRVLG